MSILKYFIIIFVALAVTVCEAEIAIEALVAGETSESPSTSSAATPEPSALKVSALRLAIDLVDGSHVIGVPRIKSIAVQTSYANIDIPLKQILSIEIGDDHKSASLELLNGDKLKAVMDIESVNLKTIFGDVSVLIQHIGMIAVDDGNAVWISQDATYTASSVYSGQSPLPSLLKCEGRLYTYRVKNRYAFHTAIQSNPFITIDLGREKIIKEIHIKSRKGFGKRNQGITAWASNDRDAKGEQVWMSEESLDEYTVSLSKPRRARFITIGLQRRDYFHLQHVKVFGQDR